MRKKNRFVMQAFSFQRTENGSTTPPADCDSSAEVNFARNYSCQFLRILSKISVCKIYFKFHISRPQWSFLQFCGTVQPTQGAATPRSLD